MQGGFRVFLGRRSLQVVLGPQPLAKSASSVMFHRRVGFTDWSQTEVVGPPNHHPVELFYYGLPVQPGFVSSGFLAYRLTDALHPFLRRGRAQIGSARFGRVTPTKRVTQKVKLLFRQLTDPRLLLVHRQLPLRD